MIQSRHGLNPVQSLPEHGEALVRISGIVKIDIALLELDQAPEAPTKMTHH